MQFDFSKCAELLKFLVLIFRVRIFPCDPCLPWFKSFNSLNAIAYTMIRSMSTFG
jgi:hypothetical protein